MRTLASAMLAVAAAAQAQQVDHAQHAAPMEMDHAAHAEHAAEPAAFTPVPPLTDADRAAAAPPAGMHEFHDNDIHSYLLLERLETWRDAGSAGATWEGKGWMGTDVTRLWLRTEGERFAGQTHGADVELLYGRSVSPWWDVVAGMRQDFAPGGSRTFAAIGLQGLAPQRYEVAATAYFGSGNQGALRLEAGREVLLTNRLIAQPRLELTLFSQDDVRHGIAAGLYEVEAGLRLRYEITRQFAPYFGLSYVRATGDTAALRRDAGEAAEDLRVVAGLRLWF